MKINLVGACNARDLGGINTRFGTIKPNLLVRSGELSRLTPSDVQTLKALPLKRIVDLRTQAEIANVADVAIDGVEVVNIPVIAATTFGITYEKSSGEEIAQMLEAGFKRMQARNETYEMHMILLYKKFVTDEYSRNAYGQFLKLLANKPISGVTLWHCTAGKDRVGTCTALLLHCLGATREQIETDYLLTNEQSHDSKVSILNKVRNYVTDSNLKMIDKMLSADKSYINSFYDEITAQFGNTEEFLTQCGVTQNDIDLLRKNYLK